MDMYIGTKLVYAEPAEKDGVAGYKVKYVDGYESWSPADVFEKAYLKCEANPALKSGVSISPDMVDNFIKEIHSTTLGDKTTVVRVVLVNGFEIVESSACVDPANYDEELGTEFCMEKVRNKVWELLGFLLQTAVSGIKPEEKVVEEPVKSTKKFAMLSQPMGGLSDEEIVATRERAIKVLEEKGYEVVNTLFTDEWYSKENMEARGVVQIPLCFLAKSLENMSLCHAAYFCKGWENARGCKVEHAAAIAYGLELLYEED